MKKQLGAFALCGALLVSSGVAFSQPYVPGQQHGYDNHGHDNRGHNGHGQDHRHAPPARHGMYEQGRHEGWYKRGGHVPKAYRGSRYVVNDWRGAHLRQPPRGYHWVRSDNGDYLMVAIATGLIASIIAASH